MTVISDPAQLTEGFVSVESVNPDLADAPGENELAERVAEVLARMGAAVESQEVQDGRANVLGVLPGDIDCLVVLEAHLDTVPMPVAPLPVGVVGGRLWGRGSCDTKASIAAMLVAMQRIAGQRAPRPTVMFAGVVDEEYVMRGAQALARRIPEADAVIIGEPTNLRVVRAHNGCVRFDIQVHGRTAHSSRATLGRNAIIDASTVILQLNERLGVKLETATHPLTGAGLLTATVIDGGIAPNVVPDSCTVRFDRRMVPGETIPEALSEVDAILAQLFEESGLRATRSDPWLDLPPVEMKEDHPLVQAALAVCHHGRGGTPALAEGVPYCTDANVLTGQAGLPSIVMGPGSIDQAHSPEEWVSVQEIRDCVDRYVGLVAAVGRGSESRGSR